MAITQRERRLRIKKRLRNKISGTSERPRLSVYRSNLGIYAQVIDDTQGKTLASATWSEFKADKVTKTEYAVKVGKKLAEVAKEAGVEQVVFDRNGYRYHGRVKALADAAREGGLKF